MRKCLLVVAVCVSILGCDSAARQQQQSKQRVEAMLRFMQEGGGPSEAIAQCWWCCGVGNCEATGEAANAFDQWRRDRDVYEIRSYAVGEATASDGATRVACTINGKELAIRVRPGEPLTWAE